MNDSPRSPQGIEVDAGDPPWRVDVSGCGGGQVGVSGGGREVVSGNSSDGCYLLLTLCKAHGAPWDSSHNSPSLIFVVQEM